MSDNEEEVPKIKLKKSKTRLKKLKDEEEQEADNNDKNIENSDSDKEKKKKRSKTTIKKRKKKLLENDIDNDAESKPRRKKRKKRIKKEENNSSQNSENEELNNNNINTIDAQDEEKTTIRKKRKRKRKKLNNEEEDNNDDDNKGNNDDINEEKPKKRRKRKKKKKLIEEDEENNKSDNDNNNNVEEEESAEKKKRRRRRKRKKKNEEENDEENNDGNNDEDNNNKGEMENNEENENSENEKKVKKKKKRKKKKIEKKLSFDNNEKNILVYEQEEEKKNKFSKTKTRVEKLIMGSQRPQTSYILRAAKMTFNFNTPLVEIEDKEEKEIDINKKENIENNIEYDNCDINWKSIKKTFLKEIEGILNELNIYETIDIALISTTNFTKKEYGDFIINNHHVISPLKNFNNINWAKEPFSLLKEKLYDLSSPGNLIEKNNFLDFSNRACNEFEVYDAKINLLKVSGNDIKEKAKPETYTFISKEDKDKLKPTLILFFSLNNEKSIILYKEILHFLKDYNDNLIFMPINAPLIQEEKNIYFVMDMLNRYKVYQSGDKFEIYFSMDDALNKRFKYISEDNKRNIDNRVVYLDVLNGKLTVDVITDMDNFTFNLIDKRKIINKKNHKSTLHNLFNLKQSSKKLLKDTPLEEPFNCNLILKKAKIYHISKESQKLKLKATIYNGLTGNIKGENLYFNEKQKYQNLLNLFKNLGNYQLRYNPANFSLSHIQINQLVINEMTKCLKMNNKLKDVNYQSIFQTKQIILSIWSQLNIQKFMPIEINSFKLEIQVGIDLFEEFTTMNIIGAMQGLTLYTYFSNCDYIACYPKLGEIFPKVFTLTDSESFEEINVDINPEGDKPSLLIIFSLALQNFFASSELSSRLKLIKNKIEKFYKEKSINLYLIYRGEPSNFSERFEQISDEQIFSLCPRLYIKSSSNMKFPLIYQNNDIESTDSQIMSFILNKENKLVYAGNLEDIQIDKTFDSLIKDDTGEINKAVIYKLNNKLLYENYKEKIKQVVKDIENIIEKELSKENKLLYRPFFSISYNTYTNFENEKTDNERYVNHNRLRILIKEKHINIFKNNEEFKKLSNNLKKKYDASTLVVSIECENININPENKCDTCNKEININQEPWYLDEDSQKIFCEKCGEDFSNDIKNETFITYFKTNEFKDEIIHEMYSNYIKRNANLNPVLGDKCKICKDKIGDVYYLNMTHFNIDYGESPIIPIDICDNCFNEMKKGEPFLNDSNKRINYEKKGLDYKHMIYRKIYLPLSGRY